MEERGNTFKSCVNSHSHKGGVRILIGSTNTLLKSTIPLVATVASMWLQYMDVFCFVTKSLVVELNIVHWFPDGFVF